MNHLRESLGANATDATLAVNALAAASGKDFRRDARGNLRPLAAIVADYRRELALAVH